MEQLLEYRARLLERYETVADELGSMLKDIPQQDWHTPLEPGTWSAHQILSHVRDAKLHEFFPCIQSILNQQTPWIDCFDRKAWMAVNYRPDEPPEAIWREFHNLHVKGLERLRQLDGPAWGRLGRHPTWGLRTLQWWVEMSLAHIEEHLRQLKKS